MKKTLLIVSMLFVAVVVVVGVNKNLESRAQYRACRFYVALPDVAAHYPTSYEHPECLWETGDAEWDAGDVSYDFYEHPYEVEERPAEGESWSIVAGGDIMAHADLQLGAYMHRDDPGETSGGYDWVLGAAKEIVFNADLAVANLETPVSPSAPRSGHRRFNADPYYLDALKKVGFDVLMTANNHALDQGVRGIRETHEELAKRGFVGVGTNPRGREAPRHAMVEIGDVSKIRVAFLNYTLVLNETPVSEGRRYLDYLRAGKYVNWFDSSRPNGVLERAVFFARDRIFRSNRYADRESFLRSISRDIELARNDGAEYVILFVHWGRYFHPMNSLQQREMALELCRRGADAILGSGPHMIQPIEKVYTKDDRAESNDAMREHLVVYSLGDLVTYRRNASGYGMLLDLRLARAENGVYIRSVKTHVVTSVPEVVTVDLVDGGTASLGTYHVEMADISEFLDAIQPSRP